MKPNTILRAPEGDGAAGGGTAAPAQTQQTQSPQTSAPPQQVKDIWGGRSAPDWVRQTGLAKTHSSTDVSTPNNDDGAHSGDRQTAPAQTTDGQTQQTAQPTQQTHQTAAAVTQQVQQQVPQAQALDPNALADAIVRAQAAAQQRTGNASAQPTAAEIRQQLAIFEATDQDYEDLLGVKPDKPERVAALNRILQAVAKQAVTINSVLQTRALEQQSQSFAPYVGAVRAQEAERQRQLFSTENPDLKGYEPLAEKVYAEALSSGRRFPTVEAARKHVADETRRTLKAMNITPVATTNGTTPSSATSQSQQQVRKMTTTSVGGRGGSSGGSTSQPANQIEAVWGKK